MELLLIRFSIHYIFSGSRFAKIKVNGTEYSELLWNGGQWVLNISKCICFSGRNMQVLLWQIDSVCVCVRVFMHVNCDLPPLTFVDAFKSCVCVKRQSESRSELHNSQFTNKPNIQFQVNVLIASIRKLANRFVVFFYHLVIHQWTFTERRARRYNGKSKNRWISAIVLSRVFICGECDGRHHRHRGKFQ